ncbi:hypothetical protein GMRT_11497 [Giardia muris]|uniref:Uncharacterized protein n=1 Tax=Giardia muris TaxID=5742 RepID=A0A4Z1TB94_GIAMU|nr:hypothetical protein GMRT_11497 [Giardia muris]|eukprot:TNJ29801.1 hypothetical protein GMRT_11497 [Giardia muris]
MEDTSLLMPSWSSHVAFNDPKLREEGSTEEDLVLAYFLRSPFYSNDPCRDIYSTGRRPTEFKRWIERHPEEVGHCFEDDKIERGETIIYGIIESCLPRSALIGGYFLKPDRTVAQTPVTMHCYLGEDARIYKLPTFKRYLDVVAHNVQFALSHAAQEIRRRAEEAEEEGDW